ncbi:MmgE/PrpD family protein [Falsiroseomonas sp. HW251]|uniref:MmgE/PrpD family protein n=1 Tax=Falsiroseomonas sp. HW251 TaxID=3390998 RepID=UPI003D310167
MPAPLTRAYGDFLGSMATRAVPASCLAVARLGFTDSLGVLLAGRAETAVTTLRAALRSDGDGGEVPALLGAARASASGAALLDATAAHALDYDDFAFSNHPSAVIVPAVLAVAARSGADGRRMAAAYVAGYEVWCDLFLRERDHYYSRGWHPTAVLGPVGAAAAAAVAMGLDAERAMHAIAIAASQGGGVFENFGSMVKPLHGGRAAQSGVVAAGLAAAGMTASPTALEGASGLMRALSPNGNVDIDTPPRLSETWHSATRGLNLKRYPVVGAAQRLADMAVGLHAAGAPRDAAQVARIAVTISEKHLRVMPFGLPEGSLQAKFSLPFIVACGLRHGRVGLAEVSDEAAADPAIRALAQRIVITTTAEADPNWPDAAPTDVLEIETTDGRRIAAPPVARWRGHADNPMDAAELRAKFMDCARYADVPQDRASALFDTLQRLEDLPGAAAITSVLGATHG